MEILALEAALEMLISLLPFFLGAAYLITVSILLMSKVREIFQRLRQKHGITKGDVGFLQKTMKSGQATHIQGIFNTQTNQVRGYQLIKANTVDAEINNALNRYPVVVFD